MKHINISYNFTIAKFFSIFIIALAHYLDDIFPLLWVPSTIGLFVFAFSSGFFTSYRYSASFSLKPFWAAKMDRLGYDLIIIDIFLLFLFIAQGKTGIITWYTVPSLFGLNGFLNWLQIPSSSPFGAGLWFFTLLFIFYLLYPFINSLFNRGSYAFSFEITFFFITIYLQYSSQTGHMLWITAFAMTFGVYCQRFIREVPFRLILSGFPFALITMPICNTLWHSKFINLFFIFIISILISLFLVSRPLPIRLFRAIFPLAPLGIYIYFLHTYLFIPLPNQHWMLSSSLSIIITAFCSLLLYRIRIIVRNIMAFSRYKTESS